MALGVDVLFSKAALALEDQRHDELVRAADWALRAAEAADDPYGQMLASVATVGAALVTDPIVGLRAAEEHHAAVVRLFDVPMLTGAALCQLGKGFWMNERRAEASDAFRRAIDAAGDVSPHVRMFGLISLGVMAAENREPDALQFLSQSVALYRNHPVEPGSIVGALLAVAFVLDEAGRTAEAATCVGAASALQESLGVRGQLILEKEVGVVVDRIAAAGADPEIAAAEPGRVLPLRLGPRPGRLKPATRLTERVLRVGAVAARRTARCTASAEPTRHGPDRAISNLAPTSGPSSSCCRFDNDEWAPRDSNPTSCLQRRPVTDGRRTLVTIDDP
jgi:hypothetical protein